MKFEAGEIDPIFNVMCITRKTLCIQIFSEKDSGNIRILKASDRSCQATNIFINSSEYDLCITKLYILE